MKIRRLLRSLLQLCAGCVCGFMAALVFSQPLAQPLAYRIEIEAPSDLRALLEEGLSLTRWQADPEMTPELLTRLLDEAVRETRETAATEGYFSPAIETNVERQQVPWRVRIRVVPGERTLIGRVDLDFRGPASGDADASALLREIRRGWSLPPGAPFRQEAWARGKEEAVRHMARFRYAAARIARSEARIDPGNASAELEVMIDSGPAFRYGALQISGLKRYPESLVRNLSPVAPGEVHDRDRLLLYQRRLIESGYFVGSQVDVVAEPDQAAAAPVSVAVIEGPSQRVEAGIGYRTDTALRTELRYSDFNLRDSAWRMKADLRLDNREQGTRVEFDSPPRTEASWNNFSAGLRRSDIQNEVTRELMLGASHNWGLGEAPSAVFTSAHVEQQRLENTDTERRAAIFFGYRYGFRHTDDLVLPRSGYFGTLSLGGAPPALATRPFGRASARVSMLIPLGARTDVILRAEGGVVLAAGHSGIPSTFLFRTGGDQTIRGYAFESLGVRQGSAVVGGRYLALGSAEYVRWIGASWGIAGFVDGGNAWDDPRSLKTAWGYGLGARLRTPVGPIRADLAYGQQARQVRLHLSIGFTF